MEKDNAPFETFVRQRLAKSADDMFVIGELQSEASRRIVALLNNIGSLSKCKGCGAEIWWVEHHNGKKAPYTKDGLNHFADCPQAANFRKGKDDV